MNRGMLFSLISILAGNFSVLLFVLLGKAEAFDALLIYWAELASFGFLCFFAFFTSSLWAPGMGGFARRAGLTVIYLFIGAFMLVWYGIFCAGYLLLLFMMRGFIDGTAEKVASGEIEAPDFQDHFLNAYQTITGTPEILFPCLALVAGHAFFIAGKFVVPMLARKPPEDILLRPLVNLFGTHFFVILAGGAMILTRSFLPVLAALVVVKTMLDLRRACRGQRIANGSEHGRI